VAQSGSANRGAAALRQVLQGGYSQRPPRADGNFGGPSAGRIVYEGDAREFSADEQRMRGSAEHRHGRSRICAGTKASGSRALFGAASS
jgi:hypothetical protein